MKIIVIGGGVIGLACAFHLQKAGSEVTVIEAAAQCGLGASRGNAGWIVPFLSSPRPGPGAVSGAFREMFKRDGAVRVRPNPRLSYLSWLWGFWRSSTEKKNHLGTQAMLGLAQNAMESLDRIKAIVPFEMYKDGLMVAALSENALQHMVESHKKLHGYGYLGTGNIIEGRQLRQIEPALSDNVHAAFHLIDERHVRPESLMKGMSNYLRDSGAKIIESRPVQRLLHSGAHRWSIMLDNGEVMNADSIVVAAGTYSKQILNTVGISLPLEAAKGVSITARGKGTRPKHPLKLLEAMVACSPFSEAVRLSGTYDLGYGDVQFGRERLDAVIQNAKVYLRDWEPEEIEFEWAGLRPVTPDDLPVIGPVPKYDGLFVATGHGTLGVTLASVTGEMISSMVCKEQEVPEMQPFNISRFAK